MERERYCFITGGQLREILKEVPDDAALPTVGYDFTTSHSTQREMMSKKDVCELGEQAPSIVFAGDDHMSQVNIHSAKQDDLYDIQPVGTMRTVLFGPVS